VFSGIPGTPEYSIAEGAEQELRKGRNKPKTIGRQRLADGDARNFF
jgi:hypothetical protein